MSMKKEERKSIIEIDTNLEVAALGIVAILFLEALALLKGIDGTMFGAAMAAIGAIVGWVFKGKLQKIN